MAATQSFTNSSLIVYTKLSPNHSGKRTQNIDTIAIHCMAGNLSVETCGNLFANQNRKASSNYGIGSDGRCAMYVEEKNRSWCTSSNAVDQRAVTIEVANSEAKDPWPVTDAAYKALIALCVDICRRNNIKKLLWLGDKSLLGNVAKQNMVPHRWLANKACPGNTLYNNFSDIAKQVNAALGTPAPTVQAINVISDTPEKIIWNFFKGKGLNAYAIAGIMGNLYPESGLQSNNLQNTYEKKLGYTDDTYTAAVDSGKYTNFVRDQAGYGLAQWTYWSRKQNLLNYAKKVGKSIGDINMQLDFLWSELQGYKNLMNVLKNAKSVREASTAFLLDFERPATKDTEATQNRRAAYAEEFFQKNADGTTNVNHLPYSVKVNDCTVLNIRSGPGTNYKIAGSIKDNGIYTITQESSGMGAKKWGKLKSGVGWISLDYCIKVS